MIVLEKYGFSCYSHRKFLLFSMMLGNTISFILDVRIPNVGVMYELCLYLIFFRVLVIPLNFQARGSDDFRFQCGLHVRTERSNMFNRGSREGRGGY